MTGPRRTRRGAQTPDQRWAALLANRPEVVRAIDECRAAYTEAREEDRRCRTLTYMELGKKRRSGDRWPTLAEELDVLRRQVDALDQWLDRFRHANPGYSFRFMDPIRPGLKALQADIRRFREHDRGQLARHRQRSAVNDELVDDVAWVLTEAGLSVTSTPDGLFAYVLQQIPLLGDTGRPIRSLSRYLTAYLKRSRTAGPAR